MNVPKANGKVMGRDLAVQVLVSERCVFAVSQGNSVASTLSRFVLEGGDEVRRDPCEPCTEAG